jgi:hypothetical protein
MDRVAHAAAGSGDGYCPSVSRRVRLGNRALTMFALLCFVLAVLVFATTLA